MAPPDGFDPGDPEPACDREEATLATDTGCGRLRTNLAWQVVGFVVQAAIGVWYTPYLINHLGIAAYGLIPLATQVASYLGILTLAQTSAIGRFLTTDLVRGDLLAANRTFSTAVIGMLMAVPLLCPLAAAVGYLVPRFIVVPQGLEMDVRWLLGGALGAFLLMLPSNAFLSCSFASNRLDVQTRVTILGVALRSGVVVVLFALLKPAVWQVGASMGATACVTLVVAVCVWRRLAPALHVRWRSFDRQRLSEILGMGNWLVLNQVGVLLLFNADLVLVNLIAGPSQAGTYGAILQWPVLLRAVAAVMAGVLGPTITARNALGDVQAVTRICHQSVRLMGLVLALPVGLICGFSRPLLGLWLGEDFDQFGPLLVCLAAPVAFTSAAQPLAAVHVACARVRWPGIMALLAGFANVGLAVLFGQGLHWGAYGVAAASIVVFVLRNGVFLPWYTAHVLQQRAPVFLANTVLAAVYTTAVYGVSALMVELLRPEGWLGLVACGLAVALLWSVLGYVTLRAEDRALLCRLGRLRADP